MDTQYYIGGIAGIILQVFIWGILIGKIVVAGELWARRPQNRASKIALGTLSMILIGTAVVGFVPRIVVLHDYAMVLLHGVLFFLIWSFVVARKTEDIADALEHNYDGKSK